MILAKHLHELVTFKTPTSAVVSLYLDLTSGDPLRVLAGLRHNLEKRKTLSPEFDEDLRRMERFIGTELAPRRQAGLALFSSKRFGLWRACRLPYPVRERLSIDETPYLAPLLSLTDQHHRFGVVLADARGARFLEVFLGRVSEYPEMALTAAPGEPQPAFLKRLTDKLEGLSRNQAFQRIVIGVSAELSLALVNHLHSSLQQNLILDPGLDPSATAEATLQRIAACEADARRVRESVLVRRLLDSAGGGKLAVLGLERTLAALQRGQVRALLVREGFAKMGRVCPSCGLLSLNWPKCLSCRRPTDAVFNVIGEMLQRAYDQNCEVYRIFSDTPLDNVGKIGAELSHEQAAAPAPAPAGEPMPA